MITGARELRRSPILARRAELERSGLESGLSLSASDEDPTWDAFIAETPGARYLQTSWWAETKTWLGWQTGRVTVSRGGRIVAGAQVLLRPVPVHGTMGYVSRAPIGAADDPAAAEVMFDGLDRFCRARQVQYLVVQPPPEQESIVPLLLRRGYRTGFAVIEPNPSATVVVDLSDQLEAILARMKEKTRYNIRLAERRGVRVREAGQDDLGVCYQMLSATAARQDFALPDESYFVRLWRYLSPAGHLRIFVTEYEGEVLSALVLIAFKDTVTFKFGGWSGAHSKLHPNELMHWAAMRWAKENGFRYYDFESICKDVAGCILQGEPLPNPHERTVSTFKLGFGGEVRVLPPPYERVSNPMLRYAYNPLSSLVMSSPSLTAGIKRASLYLRTRHSA